MGFWTQLEEKFPLHFYNGTNEIKLSNLTSVKQGHHESILYIRRFRVVKTQCFSLKFSKKKEENLADLTFVGLRSRNKEKVEHFDFLTINQLFPKASAVKSKSNIGESRYGVVYGRVYRQHEQLNPNKSAGHLCAFVQVQSTCMVEMD
jgi:hypothetical protein